MNGLEYTQSRDPSHFARIFPTIYPSTNFVATDPGKFIYKDLPERPITSDPLRNWLNKILPQTVTWTKGEERARSLDYYQVGRPPGVVSPFVDKLARFIVAFTGGLSLVVPMIIMRVDPNPNKSFITTAVAVVLFSGVVSVLFKVSNAETLGITAAYAAVLVVFVGTSG